MAIEFRNRILELFLLVYLGLKYRANFWQVIVAFAPRAMLGLTIMVGEMPATRSFIGGQFG
jgi:hypothetical protein